MTSEHNTIELSVVLATLAVAETALFLPIDVIKSVQQFNNLSVTQAARAIYFGGGIRRFYAGMSWPLASASMARMALFMPYILSAQSLTNAGCDNKNIKRLASAFVSGAAYGLVNTPAEVYSTYKANNLPMPNYTLRALYKGFALTSMRASLMAVNGLAVADIMVDYFGYKQAYQQVVLTSLLGMFGATIATPIEVVRVNYVLDPKKSTMVQHYKQARCDGSLFRSVTLRNIRVGLSVGFTYACVQAVNNH